MCFSSFLFFFFFNVSRWLSQASSALALDGILSCHETPWKGYIDLKYSTRADDIVLNCKWLNFQFWVNFTPFNTSVVCFGFDFCFQPHTKNSIISFFFFLLNCLLLFNSSTSQHQYLLNIISWIQPLTPYTPPNKCFISLQCFHLRRSTFAMFNALPEA